MGKTTTLCVRRATYWDADMKVSLSLKVDLPDAKLISLMLARSLSPSIHPLEFALGCAHTSTRARSHRVGT